MVEMFFLKITFFRTLKRLKRLDDQGSYACVCVYVCACSLLYGCHIPAGFLPVRLTLSPGCGALPLPLSSNVAGRLPSACSTLPLSLSLFQPRRPIAVCWCSLNAHALCSVLPGVGRQPMPCLWLILQQARWLCLQQAQYGVVAVVYIPQEMRPLLASGWR